MLFEDGTLEVVLEASPRESLGRVRDAGDFAGVAAFTLASIFLQKAQGYTVKQAGFALGAMMLISVIVNPIAVWITSANRRLKSLALLIIAGGVKM